MRHSIMGERRQIDKERTEIRKSAVLGMGHRAQRMILGHGRSAQSMLRFATAESGC